VVYQRRYEWDKNWNLTQTLDELGGWRAEYGLDDAGRLVRINTIAGAGSNPFPWPVGLTTVTSDANGSIRALVNGTWRAEFEVDYEGRLTEIRWPGYKTVRVVYDGVGRKCCCEW
jgi:YD repeat-containing protein